MGEIERLSRALDHDAFVDQIYEIALEPTNIDEFIKFLVNSGLADPPEADESRHLEALEKPSESHLFRAQEIMRRGEPLSEGVEGVLREFESFAALVVNDQLTIEAVNAGAQTVFDVSEGEKLDRLGLSEGVQEVLFQAVLDVIRDEKSAERVIKAELGSERGALVLRVFQSNETHGDGRFATIVSTHFRWHTAIELALRDTFELTKAEQEITRGLAEGLGAKSIAAERGSTETTVRGQIKSILSKLNLRSQSDVVRLIIWLGAFSKNEEAIASKTEKGSTVQTKFDEDVWKPFQSIILPDGRTYCYHEIGPVTGAPILISHMTSCTIRWTAEMHQLAHESDLRVICPIRAGYGPSDSLPRGADVLRHTREDLFCLLEYLEVSALPYVVQGSDYVLTMDLYAHRPKLLTEIISFGGKPCLPGGHHIDGRGSWQRFFVNTARRSPKLARFASTALMAMGHRIGAKQMLHELCRESASDIALLNQNDDVREVLESNIRLMLAQPARSARAFAMEFVAFHADWSGQQQAAKSVPTTIFWGREDPTVDLSAVEQIELNYPWIELEVVPRSGQALLYQNPKRFVPILADAAHRAV